MHFYMRLIQLFPFTVIMQNGVFEPPGFDHIITIRGNFVVTVRNNYVIASE